MDDILRQLMQGRLNSGQLPPAINIWDLEEGLDELRRRSLDVPPHQQVEWGGCIVLQEDRLQLVHTVKGWKEGVDPNCLPDDHDRYVGFAHIHLSDGVTGQPYLGFSECDFRGTLADGDHLALVCNGPEVFALVRTQDRTQSRRVAGDSEFKSWEQLYDDLIERARSEMAADPEARQRGSVLLNRPSGKPIERCAAAWVLPFTRVCGESRWCCGTDLYLEVSKDEREETRQRAFPR